MSDFDKALDFTLSWEGNDAITDDPNDPGGLTKYGISKRAHPDVDIRALTREDAAAIYERDYWKAGGCHLLPWALNAVHFDACVNHGPGRAAGFLKMAGGKVGAYLDAREQFYHTLVAKKPALGKFLRGWINRVNAARKVFG